MTPRRLTVLAVLALVLSWPWLAAHTITLLNYIALYSLVACGLVLLTGIGGMTSFGQAAFMGLGAYATAWVCTAGAAYFPVAAVALPWLGLATGLLLTTLVAFALGAITLRLSGHYLPLCTIAWGLSLYYLFGTIGWLGGHTGLSGIPPLVLGRELESPRELGILIWAVLLVVIAALSNLLDSREGRALRALKNHRLMAESMGVDTTRYRIKVFVLAAALAALSGWFYAHLQRFINPTPFSLHIGIELLFMAVVGGAGHLWGAVLGATLITLLKSYLQDFLPHLLGATGNFEVIVFGLLMLFVLQRFPEGLWPSMANRVRVGLRFAGTGVGPLHPITLVKGLKLEPLSHVPGRVVLEAERVTKQFGGLVANNAITMDVRAAEIHALIGPNGAGKSTFFNMVSGVDAPTSGRVVLMGRDMKGLPSRAFAALGMGRTFQHVRLLGTRSVMDNVALGAHRQGRAGWLASMLRLDRREEDQLRTVAYQQLVRCGLHEQAEIPAASLPLGQQRLVEIARALAGQPRVLLLDEPAAGLRHLEKKALATLLCQLRDEGVALMVVEHDMEFVMNIADRITVLEFGQVIAQGSPQAIQQDPKVLAAYLGGADDDEPGAA